MFGTLKDDIDKYRLLSITKNKTMRTLNSNQLTEQLPTTKSYVWNAKRRYR